MTREDAHKLLGGYATGTLTAEERQALFEAALTDQELFDALAREEALRETLADPAARAQLLAAVDGAPASARWQWRRLAPVAAMAAALVVVTMVMMLRQDSRPARRRWVAEREAPAAAPHAAPILPPPPEVARVAPPVLTPLRIPMPAPVPPPPPPAAAATARAALAKAAETAAETKVTVQGSMRGNTSGQIQGLPSSPRPNPSVAYIINGAGSAGLSQALIPLHGTVTDSTGAGVPSATVEVKSLDRGEVFKTSTNPRGEFSAPGPVGAYQIDASARGFKTATVSGVAPASGVPVPVNVRLEVGSATESVEVSAAAGPVGAGGPAVAGRLAGVQGQMGVGGFNPATAARALTATVPPPVQTDLPYRLLRRMPDGSRADVGADGNVAAGSTVIMAITPQADGYLRITQSNGHAILNRAVRAMQPVETQLPKFKKPGRVQFQMIFRRQQAAEESETITLNFQ
jgi:hypothetical protein